MLTSRWMPDRLPGECSTVLHTAIPPLHLTTANPAYDWEYAREQAKYEREMDTEMRLAVVLNPERVWRGITACGL